MCGLASAVGVGPPCVAVRVLWALFGGAVILSAGLPATAFPIRVSTATELVLDPELSPDRQHIRLTVRLRDDQGIGVGRSRVSVSVASPSGLAVTNDVLTEADGSAAIEAPLDAQTRVVTLDANFAGTDRLASAHAHAEVELDAPYVTVELLAPATPIALGAAPPIFIARVNTGHVVGLNADGLPVALTVVEPRSARVIAAGVCDASGQVSFVVRPDAFPSAGAYTLRPRVEVRPQRYVEGTGRRVVVRVDTVLTAALVSEPDDLRARVRGQLRSATNEPLARAPVRLMRGDDTIVAGQTDAAGEFVFEVDLDRTNLQGSAVRVRFDPTDPWFGASESTAFVIGESPAAPIHWAWTIVPWLVLGLIGVAAALRRRATPAAAVSAPIEAAPEGVVVRTGAAPDGAVEVMIEPFDRSTGASLPAATWRLTDASDAPANPSSVSVPVGRGKSAFVVVALAGYEPRRVELSRLGPGRHRVRVGLMGWREALFDRARPSLASARADGAAMPTPREAARSALPGGTGAPWVGLLEDGAYGPAAPDEDVVRAVERALTASNAANDEASDAVDAVN